MNKKLKTIILFSIYFVVFFILIKYFKNVSELNVMRVDVSEKQWAYNNFGQDINGTKGIPGIDINIQPAWDITMGDPNVIVAIVDTGIAIEMNSIKDNILNKGINCWDFYNNDDSIFDSNLEDYHGTYIANVISGVDKDNAIMGVAPKITLFPVKFMKGTSGNSNDATRALQYACENGAKIINCSWNFNSYNKEMYDVISKYPDIVFICSAGNYNCNLDETDVYPACFKLDNIITVSAVNNKGELYESSGYGKNVDVAAPGENVIVTFPSGKVAYINGTSVAVAIVSGIVSLMLSENRKISPIQIKNIIVENSKKIKSLKGFCKSEGIIDAYECLLKVKRK